MGVIVPHAGTVYSGPTAGFAYACVDPARVDRVVMLGPAHHVPVDGIGSTTAAAWRTPLGDVEVDVEVAADLAAEVGSVRPADAAHAPEHSLEVQLPFLQRVLGDGWRLVPLLVGTDLPNDVAAAITWCAALPRTLIVVSTDLSHYLDYEAAVARDSRTIRAIGQRRADAIGTSDACGRYPLRGLLTAADGQGWTVRLLDARNSGDTAGSRDRVVGYAAFSLTARVVPPSAGADLDRVADPVREPAGDMLGVDHGPSGHARTVRADEHGPAAGDPAPEGPEADGSEAGGFEAGGSEAGGSEPGGPEAGGFEAGGFEASGPEAGGLAAGRSGESRSEADGTQTRASAEEDGRIGAESRSALLSLARRTIEEALASGRRPPFDLSSLGTADPVLRAPGAAFVTLRSGEGDLLGCIGSLTARQGLAADVAEHAFDAAFRDPRFPPLTPDRARGMVVDISVLSAPRPFPCASYSDLMTRAPRGRGLVVHSGRHRATFLPAVWEQLPDPRSFVAGLWRKAGLAPSAWPSGTTIEVYDSEEFAES